jgi:hypothetical protein
VHIDSASLGAALVLSDGANLPWYGYPLSSERDASVSGELTPGQEVKMRVFFDVPISETVTPASFRFSEGDSRVYVSDLKDVKRAAPRAA